MRNIFISIIATIIISSNVFGNSKLSLPSNMVKYIPYIVNTTEWDGYIVVQNCSNKIISNIQEETSYAPFYIDAYDKDGNTIGNRQNSLVINPNSTLVCDTKTFFGITTDKDEMMIKVVYSQSYQLNIYGLMINRSTGSNNYVVEQSSYDAWNNIVIPQVIDNPLYNTFLVVGFVGGDTNNNPQKVQIESYDKDMLYYNNEITINANGFVAQNIRNLQSNFHNNQARTILSTSGSGGLLCTLFYSNTSSNTIASLTINNQYNWTNNLDVYAPSIISIKDSISTQISLSNNDVNYHDVYVEAYKQDGSLYASKIISLAAQAGQTDTIDNTFFNVSETTPQYLSLHITSNSQDVNLSVSHILLNTGERVVYTPVTDSQLSESKSSLLFNSTDYKPYVFIFNPSAITNSCTIECYSILGEKTSSKSIVLNPYQENIIVYDDIVSNSIINVRIVGPTSIVAVAIIAKNHYDIGNYSILTFE